LATKTNTDGLSPEIRGWVDDCLVPLLVKEYETKLEKQGKVRATDSLEVSP
jgi:hypothetical protein